MDRNESFARSHAGCPAVHPDRRDLGPGHVVGWYRWTGDIIVGYERFPVITADELRAGIEVVVDNARHGELCEHWRVELMCTHTPSTDDRFPHVCGRCGRRAYVGFSSVEHEDGSTC